MLDAPCAADNNVAGGAGEGSPAAGTANILLHSLAPADYEALRPCLRRVRLAVGERIAAAGEPIETVCFLEGGVAGFLDVLSDGRRLCVGLVGREGFVGWPLLMGDERWPYDVQLRVTDACALAADAGRLRHYIAERPQARDVLLRYAGVFMGQMGRTIVSNLIHPVGQRTARWLLLYHDRLDGDEIAITHEELGVMLGVRRSSVTDALHQLEGKGLIRSLRGRVVVRDRVLLEQWVSEAYGFVEARHQRLSAAIPARDLASDKATAPIPGSS